MFRKIYKRGFIRGFMAKEFVEKGLVADFHTHLADAGDIIVNPECLLWAEDILEGLMLILLEFLNHGKGLLKD